MTEARNNLSIHYEDPRAYPYREPSQQLKKQYKEIFRLDGVLKEKKLHRVFWYTVTILMFLLSIILWIILLIANYIEGWFYTEHKGPLLDGYISGSQGKKFIKYKFRTLKKTVNNKSLKNLDFRTRLSEYDSKNLTYLGRILKKYYLDELPQLLNILKGDINFIGPRPFAWHHHQRNIKQGHPIRRIMKAGLLSATHVRKGDADFPNVNFDYNYAEKYRSQNTIALLFEDFKIIFQGLRMIVQGKSL